MKKIIKLFRRLYTRHIFEKWFAFYLRRGCEPYVAWHNAENILLLYAPRFIFYEDYIDYLMQECCGLPPCREKVDGDKRVAPPEGLFVAKDLTL